MSRNIDAVICEPSAVSMPLVRWKNGPLGAWPSAAAAALDASSRPRMTSLPPGEARILPTDVRIREVHAASVARKTHFSHISCTIFSLATEPVMPLAKTSDMARTRSDGLPSRSPKLSDCMGLSCTTSRCGLSVAPIAQRPPSTRSRPNLLSSTPRCRMPLSSGMIEVRGPTAGANDWTASSRSKALQLKSTTSNFSVSLSACTVGGFFSVTSPFGLLITRPALASSAARFGRTRKVTSLPASSILPPKYPPMAPAPTTRMRMGEFLLLFLGASSEWRVGKASIRYSPFAIRLFSPLLPLLPERANLEFKRPGAARLLVELPVRRRHRRRRHQQIRIVQRFLAPELFAAFAHPGGVDAGIDDQMRDMDVLRPEFARHRLRHRAKPEFGAGEGGKAAASA